MNQKLESLQLKLEAIQLKLEAFQKLEAIKDLKTILNNNIKFLQI